MVKLKNRCSRCDNKSTCKQRILQDMFVDKLIEMNSDVYNADVVVTCKYFRGEETNE